MVNCLFIITAIATDSFLPYEILCWIQSLDSNVFFFHTGAYETAYHALVHCGRVQQGQCCVAIQIVCGSNMLLGELALVHGATGATGLAAVQVQLFGGRENGMRLVVSICG